MPVKLRRVSKEQIIVPLEARKVCLRKIISGGQIGVDIAALRAARSMRPYFKTGGHMPQGFATLSGRKPGYKWLYNCLDDTPPFWNGAIDWKTRTWKNVQNSDGTLRLALNFDSRGEICTLNAIHHFKRPHLDIYMKDSWESGGEVQHQTTPKQVADWILQHRIKTLNVAGNANFELEEKAYDYLREVLNLLLFPSRENGGT